MPGFFRKQVLFFLTVFFCAARVSAGERAIRVGIVPKADAFVFIPEDSYSIVDSMGVVRDLKKGKTYAVKPSDKLLSLGTLILPAEARLVPQNPTAALWIAGRRYPGVFLLRLNSNGTVTAIEKLGIEEYLLGVVGHEMDAAWPLESLKAQAVVARTFAYVQLEKSHSRGYEVTDDARSQVYGGVFNVPESVAKAVAETRGEVLGYHGRLLGIYYHSCCGGHTADAGWVWHSKNKTPRPLRGVRDPYCRNSPFYRWKAFFTFDEIRAALENKNLFGGALRFFDLGPQEDDYVENFKAQVGDRKLTVDANRFRLAIGPSNLKSVRILGVSKEKTGVEFFGAGSGHGVGLCQWGARSQAALGRSYEKILHFYFPGSTLSVVE